MPLNEQVSALLAMFAAAPAFDMATTSPDELRAANDRPMFGSAPPDVAHVTNLRIALSGRTLDARLYVPHGAQDRPPLTIFYHGGGWVIGTLDTHDATCRVLARASGGAVLSVGYRLAPEHRFPQPLDDCFDALVWAASHGEELGIDVSRLAVAGDSAGGNLAAAVAILARDRAGPRLRHQLLLYPVTDSDCASTSHVENGAGDFFLSTTMMRWFWDQYLGSAPVADLALAAIARAPDLSGLAPATVIVAEFDPLRDEGLAYADRLRLAGVPVEAAVAPGMIHGFISMFEAVPDGMPWIDRAGAALARALDCEPAGSRDLAHAQGDAA